MSASYYVTPSSDIHKETLTSAVLV